VTFIDVIVVYGGVMLVGLGINFNILVEKGRLDKKQ